MNMKDVAQETLAILKAGNYTAPSGATREVGQAQTAAVAGTRLYRPAELADLLTQQGTASGTPPTIEVWEGTTQTAARKLVEEQGERVVLLNFASARNPGGGFIRGAVAQEEDLARCSGLYGCLVTQGEYYDVNRKQQSMLYTDHLIYSPDVPFFRERANDVLERPFLASMITAPAPNAGEYLKRGQPPEQLAVALHHRAGCVLATARDQGHRVLLLGAWGCGVFRNDPAMVADTFGQWLESATFAGDFDRVVFGIYDRTKTQYVLKAFKTRFSSKDN